MVLWQGTWIGVAAPVKKLLKAIAQPVEANVFLLQPQPRADAVVAQIVVKGSLFGRQPVVNLCKSTRRGLSSLPQTEACASRVALSIKNEAT